MSTSTNMLSKNSKDSIEKRERREKEREYVTLIGQAQVWRLYQDIGITGELLIERENELQLIDLSGAQEPIVWLCGKSFSSQEMIIQKLHILDLSLERITWPGGRIGALTSTLDGRRAVILELAADPTQSPRLWLWNDGSWSAIAGQVTPDISSKLACLDESRIVFESIDRRLTILNLDTKSVEIGPPACCPASASDIREWYAISRGRVVRFPYEQSFRHTPTMHKGFDFSHVTTLRVTRDGQVFTWTEPRSLYRSKGYIQKLGRRRKRFPQIDNGVGAVLGPYSLT